MNMLQPAQISEYSIEEISLDCAESRKPRRAHLAGCLVAMLGALGIGSCASAAPYNPASLDQGRLGQVEGICQSVMGLSPKESPIPGDGNPKLDPLENHFQGCVATLSHAVQRGERSATLAQANRSCISHGAAIGSPALAECVLNTRDAPSPALTQVSAGSAPPSAPIHSFFGTSHAEKTRRMELACVRIGVNPALPAFDDCVKEMMDTFYAIDNPWN